MTSKKIAVFGIYPLQSQAESGGQTPSIELHLSLGDNAAPNLA